MSKPAQLSPESASSVLSPPEAQSAAQNVPTGISPSQPLIYACSGCSSAAQLTNHLALRMDREGHAEMSCIVGLGGDVKSLVRLAKSGRAIVMLDGCALHCGKHTLARHALSPTLHWDLSRMGVRKQKHIDFDTTDATRLEPSLAQAIKIAGADSASLAAVQRATISEVTEPENVGPRAVVHASDRLPAHCASVCSDWRETNRETGAFMVARTKPFTPIRRNTTGSGARNWVPCRFSVSREHSGRTSAPQDSWNATFAWVIVTGLAERCSRFRNRANPVGN
jgi:uncharacterized metal-binding protein